MKYFGSVIALLLVMVCATASAETDSETLTIDPNWTEVSVDEESSQVVIAYESGLMQGTYHRYFMDKDEFMRHVGYTMPEGKFDITMEILETARGNRSPDDPREAAPSGGFNIYSHTVEVISVSVGSDSQPQQQQQQEQQQEQWVQWEQGDPGEERQADSPQAFQEHQRRQAQQVPSSEVSSTFEDLSIAPGFMPDPAVLEGQAGGDNYHANPNDYCQGYIADPDSPDHVLTLTEDFQWLSIQISSSERAPLILVGVDSNSTICTGSNNKLEQPLGAGEYRLFVAAEKPDYYPDYEIKITEIP